jgi:twinkle protein
MIAQQTIDAINGSANILEVVGEFITLKKQGANRVALCPFHNEKSPSFTISPGKQIYKCFGCGRSGDAVQFLIEHQKLSYVQAIEWLGKKYNISVEHEGKRKEYVKPPGRLEKLSAKKLAYFENERLIGNDALLRLKVTESIEWMPQWPKETAVPVICFNYFRKGELVNIKFRGPATADQKKSFKLEKDAELIFYNLDALEGETEGIILEGEIDTLTAVDCGIYNVIGVPNGTPPKGSAMRLEYLDNCWEEISKLQSVILAVDDDEPGRHLKEELARRIGKHKCKVITYPKGCKDTNEVKKMYGREAVQHMFINAKPWPVEGIMPMDDMFDDIVSYYENGYPPGAAAGWDGFDELLTFYPGHLTMVTGIPGHGKDEVTNEIAVDLSKNEKWIWGVFNFEETPQVHSTKLIEKYSRKAFAYRKDANYRLSKADLDRGIGFVDQHFHFVSVSKIDVTMEGIVKKIEELVLQFGINGVIINPWNYIEHKLGHGQSETHYVSEVLTTLINCLWKHSIHGFLIAHPSKILKDKRTNKYEVPTLYSISGSAHFFNKTHNGICVYRDYEKNVTDIHIQKVKWYWLGQLGWVTYRFNTEDRQFYFETSSVTQKADSSFPNAQGNRKLLPPGYVDHTAPKEKEDSTDELPF